MGDYDNGGQYSAHSILRYEQIFGRGFVSTGGAGLTGWIADHVGPGVPRRILDVGSGLGGAAFLLAARFGASVTGIDLSPVMVGIAEERAREAGAAGVSFAVADALVDDFADGAFDLVWSRDTFLHIPDKPTLYGRLHRWLAPDGQLLITDYARGGGTLSPDFEAYAADKGYHLMPPEEGRRLLEEAGFAEVVEVDWTDRFVDVLHLEMADLRDRREAFLTAGFSGTDLDYLLSRWQRKIGFCEAGEMRACLWSARRA